MKTHHFGDLYQVEVSLNHNEMGYLNDLCTEKDMTSAAVLKQAFRIYQTIETLGLMEEVSKMITDKTFGPNHIGGCMGDD